MTIVEELQAKAINSNERVVSTLRMAKVVATKLDQADAVIWIDRELSGYDGVTAEQLPPYRRIDGTPKAFNPFHGWQPIMFSDAEVLEKLSNVPIGMPLGALEEMLDGRETDFFVFPYPPDLRTRLMKAIDFETDVHCELSPGAVFNIIDAVRNLILNWALELEKKGILGEGMAFSESEKQSATAVTQVFLNSQIGVVGSNHGGTGQVAINASIPIDEVQNILEQIEKGISDFPAERRTEIQSTVNDLEVEIAKQSVDQGVVRNLLGSLQRMCEGAGGSLLAQGAASLIARLLQ